jgi:hypothetical protein
LAQYKHVVESWPPEKRTSAEEVDATVMKTSRVGIGVGVYSSHSRPVDSRRELSRKLGGGPLKPPISSSHVRGVPAT